MSRTGHSLEMGFHQSDPLLQREHIFFVQEKLKNKKKRREKKKLNAFLWVLPFEPAAELCVPCFSPGFTLPAHPFPYITPVVFLTRFLHLWILFVYILSVSVYIKAQLCDRSVWAEQEQTLLIYGVTFIAQTICNPCWISFSLSSRNKTSWD